MKSQELRVSQKQDFGLRIMKKTGKALDCILEYEWLVLALVAYPLLFPRPWTTPLLLVIPGLWLVRALRKGSLLPLTPLNVPLLLLAIMLAVSLWATYSIEFSLPKISGLIFGLGVFFATVRYGLRKFSSALLFFMGCGLAVGGVGLLATNWVDKLPMLGRLMERFPRILGSLPAAAQGIHPNELGGVLILFLPLALLAAWRSLRPRPGRDRTIIIFWWISALWLGGMTLLTQSRSALIGLSAGLALVLFFSGRWSRIVLFAGVIIMAVCIVWIGPETLIGPSGLMQYGGFGLGEISLSGRVEIWSRALFGIQDFAFTGMGLGTFRQIVPILYPLFLIDPGKDIAHAHNLFLQTALDLGLPGLIAFMAVWVAIFAMLFERLRHAPANLGLLGMSAPDLALGLAGGVVAHFVYSLTDAIALGARPGFLLWMTFGLSTAMYLKGKHSLEGRRARLIKTSNVAAQEKSQIELRSNSNGA
jgi:putative inorganic carbon (HCO3(-)) transporter